MNISPVIHFAGNKESAKLLKSQALQFYNFEIEAANKQGIGFISRIKTLADGSSIYFFSRKEDNYELRTGKIVIFSPPVIVEKEELEGIYVTVMDKDSILGSFPSPGIPPYQHKKGRFLYPDLEKIVYKDDFYSGGEIQEISTTPTTFLKKGGFWNNDNKHACSWTEGNSSPILNLFVSGKYYTLNLSTLNSRDITSLCIIPTKELIKFYPSAGTNVAFFVVIILYINSTKSMIRRVYALDIIDSTSSPVQSINTLVLSDTIATFSTSGFLQRSTGFTKNGKSFLYVKGVSSTLDNSVTYETYVISFSSNYQLITTSLIGSVQTSGAVISTFTSTATIVPNVSNNSNSSTSSTVNLGGYYNIYSRSEGDYFVVIKARIINGNPFSSTASSSYLASSASGSSVSSGNVSSFSEVSIWKVYLNEDLWLEELVSITDIESIRTLSQSSSVVQTGTIISPGVVQLNLSVNTTSDTTRKISHVLYASLDPLIIIYSSYEEATSSITSGSNSVFLGGGTFVTIPTSTTTTKKYNNLVTFNGSGSKNIVELITSTETIDTTLQVDLILPNINPPGGTTTSSNTVVESIFGDSPSAFEFTDSDISGFYYLEKVSGSNKAGMCNIAFTDDLVVMCFTSGERVFINGIPDNNFSDPNLKTFFFLKKDSSYKILDGRLDSDPTFIINSSTKFLPLSITTLPN